MNKSTIPSLFAAALVAATVCAPAQSFLEVADATLDAVRESNEQAAAPENVRAIFAKAKEAVEDDDKLNLCGFYTGMSAADARTLAEWYKLKDGEWSAVGDPIYEIKLTLKGVRRVTKGGNTLEELAQAVANRIGTLQHKSNWKTGKEWYEMKTIDGILATMAETEDPEDNVVAGLRLFDTNAKAEAERKAKENSQKAKQQALSDFLDSLPDEEVAVESILTTMVNIPGKNYSIGKTEVTVAQWGAIMDDMPDRLWPRDPNLPIGFVSWEDCQVFLNKLNEHSSVKHKGIVFRLPTVSEWEFACRAGATGDFCKLTDGTEISESTLGQVAWFNGSSEKKMHQVGQKQPNAFGLYDMHGNVYEWCQEEWGEVYSWAKGTDHEHVRLRLGGSYYNSADDCKSSGPHYGLEPDSRFADTGFRLCADGKAD